MTGAQLGRLDGVGRTLVNGFHRSAWLLSMLGAGATVLLIVYLVLHTCIEILLRVFFSSSTFTLEEFAGYAMGGIVFLSLGYAMQSGSMIRMSMTTSRMSGEVRRVAEVVCTVLTLGFAGGAAYYFWLSLARNWQRGATSETSAAVPLWIPDALAVAGLLILCAQLVSYALQVTAGGPIVEGEEAPE